MNGEDIIPYVTGIIGMLGFGLAVYLMVLEQHRYHFRLRVKLIEVKYIQLLGDTHLVFLRIAFVNPSSVGKTVFRIVNDKPSITNVQPCPYQYKQGEAFVTCLPPNSNKGFQIQISELLWLPLDIPPHQSQTKWYPALIKSLKGGKEKHPLVYLHLRIKDISKKKLAYLEEKIELKTYILP